MLHKEWLSRWYPLKNMECELVCTVESHRLERNFCRLERLLLCSIYETKKRTWKKMAWLWGFLAGNQGILQPKAIKNELKFRKWTTKKANRLHWYSFEFMMNFHVEKKVPTFFYRLERQSFQNKTAKAWVAFFPWQKNNVGFVGRRRICRKTSYYVGRRRIHQVIF